MGNCFGPTEAKDLLSVIFGLVGSGKSTFTKQLRLMDKQMWSPSELADFTIMIRRDYIVSLQDLLRYCETEEIELETKNRKLARHVLTLDPSAEFSDWWDNETPRRITSLWGDPAVQTAFKQGSIVPNIDYFIGRLSLVAADDYVPSNDDILRLRMRTSTVTKTTINAGKYNCCFLDCGGQKSERERWGDILDSTDVHAVIFVVALDEYNTVSQENEKITKLQQSFDIFEKLFTTQAKKQTFCIVLLLNKIDLFLPKYKSDPKGFKVKFPDFKGESEDQAISFIEEKFRERMPSQFQLSCLTLCSLDIDLTRYVFEEIKKFAISARLKKSGLSA